MAPRQIEVHSVGAVTVCTRGDRHRAASDASWLLEPEVHHRPNAAIEQVMDETRHQRLERQESTREEMPLPSQDGESRRRQDGGPPVDRMTDADRIVGAIVLTD